MSIKIPKQVYECPHCLRQYRRKRERDLHIGTCELFSKNKTERSIEIEKSKDIMSMEEMNDIIKVLVSEQTKLKKKVQLLENKLSNVRKKINIIDYLNNNENENKKIIEFQEFISFITEYINEKLLHILFEENLRSFISELLDNIMRNIEINNIPIRIFDNSKNVYYYETNQTKWSIMEEDKWDILINPINKKIMSVFKEYTDNNENRICNDDKFTIQYHTNVQKIMKSIPKIKKEFMNCILLKVKITLQNITTYEFDFN